MGEEGDFGGIIWFSGVTEGGGGFWWNHMVFGGGGGAGGFGGSHGVRGGTVVAN